MKELLERDITHILSICKDYRDGYAKPEQALDSIQTIAANALELWVCRFCKQVFNSKTSKESDYFGDKCLPCAARAELAKLTNK